ncbi:MAG: ABC transporter permease [Clostridiales bacterium]|nr:ABC transporter permease [Clostridiales bacterium]MBR6484108.1 ABC transporter permease [Clostridiales bacterium]
MHLYKNFFRILNRNKAGIVIYGVIMAIMILALIFVAKASFSESSEVDVNYTITYVDNDDSAVSKGLIEYLSVNNTVEDLSDKSERSIQDIVFFSLTSYHMTIPEGFGAGEGEIEYLTAYSSGADTYYVDEEVNSYMTAERNYEALGYSSEEASKKALELMTGEASIEEVSSGEKGSRTMDFSVFYINQFFSYLIIGFLCLGVGHTVIANSDEKINSRIETSPVGKKKISFVNTMGIFTFGVMIWAVFMIINLVLGHGGTLLRDYWWVIAINLFATMMFSCSLASLVTAFPMSANVLSMVTNIISLGMSFLCGAFVQQKYLGEGVLKIAQFLPMYWSVRANNMTYSQESGFDFDMGTFIMCIGVQIAFAIAFAVAASFVKSSRLSKTA